MCFSPQRRAIFRHLNFKKWSAPEVFCTCWLGNALLSTAACNFSTSELQKVVRPWDVFYILTSKWASRYSGVQFSISRLNSYLRTRRFTKPTFRPSRPTNHWKNTAFRNFPNISHTCIFFLLTLLLWFFLIFWLCYSALLFQLSILSEVRLLNFLWWSLVQNQTMVAWFVTGHRGALCRRQQIWRGIRFTFTVWGSFLFELWQFRFWGFDSTKWKFNNFLKWVH